MTAYYNEFDKSAAQWLRNLIVAGHIAPGYVDERSIEDVYPSDLRGFTQCHFFAGIGVWSHALRQAGWSDDRPVWTGSCPCQPFSAAGKGAGFDDERHLWPAFHHLIKECKPAIIFGEQVASKAVEPWIDLVHTDMEALGYAFGCVPFPSAGVGAPHIRDRAYWAAAGVTLGDACSTGLEGHAGNGSPARWEGSTRPVAASSLLGSVADATDQRLHGRWSGSQSNGRGQAWIESERLCDAIGVADAIMQQRPNGKLGIRNVNDAGGRIEGSAEVAGLCGDSGVADDNRDGCKSRSEGCETMGHGEATGADCGAVWMADSQQHDSGSQAEPAHHGQPQAVGPENRAGGCGGLSGGLGDADSNGAGRVGASIRRQEAGEGGRGCGDDVGASGAADRTGPTNGFWNAADWLRCRDGKWRPVEPSTFPLVNGAAARVVRLRAYGNAINAQAAQAFIESVM
jgi:DNA (cytosine-5)-methyltransferase 1